MKIAVVGATGLVGSKMLQVLEERNFPVTEFIPVASEKSIGKEIVLRVKNIKWFLLMMRLLQSRQSPYFRQVEALPWPLLRNLRKPEL